MARRMTLFNQSLVETNEPDPFYANQWSDDFPSPRKYEPEISAMQQTIMTRILCNPHEALPVPFNSLLMHILESYSSLTKAMKGANELVNVANAAQGKAELELAQERRESLHARQRLTKEVEELSVGLNMLTTHITEREPLSETSKLATDIRDAIVTREKRQTVYELLESSKKLSGKTPRDSGAIGSPLKALRSIKSSQGLSDRARDSYASTNENSLEAGASHAELPSPETDQDFRALRFLAESMSRRRQITFASALSQITSTFLGFGRSTRTGLKIKKKQMAKMDTVSADLVYKLNSAMHDNDPSHFEATGPTCSPSPRLAEPASVDEARARSRAWSFATGDDKMLPKTSTGSICSEGNVNMASHGSTADLMTQRSSTSSSSPLTRIRRASDVRSTNSKIPSPKYNTLTLARRRGNTMNLGVGTVIHRDRNVPTPKTGAMPSSVMTAINSVRNTFPSASVSSESSKDVVAKESERRGSDTQQTSRKSSAAVMAARVASRLGSGSSIDLTRIMSPGTSNKPQTITKRVRKTLTGDKRSRQGSR
ncbi:MAG: hypothetical protein M1828_007268 [Chrysothrix sp. TS-e1954]|nr:MAG: hypothetical protein M1828_007268 [Chrysothrix sp. TS-e1954]